MKYVYDISSIPANTHFAALEFSSITIPGDERSRTNPGHGYPESRQAIVTYIAFKDKPELDKYVEDKEKPRFGNPDKNYKIFELKPLTVKTTVSVVVE